MKLMLYKHYVCFYPLTPTVVIMGTAVKHPVPDRVKPSSAIFDIRAHWRRSEMSVRGPGVTRSGTGCFTAVPIMTTVGVKGLMPVHMTCKYVVP